MIFMRNQWPSQLVATAEEDRLNKFARAYRLGWIVLNLGLSDHQRDLVGLSHLAADVYSLEKEHDHVPQAHR